MASRPVMRPPLPAGVRPPTPQLQPPLEPVCPAPSLDELPPVAEVPPLPGSLLPPVADVPPLPVAEVPPEPLTETLPPVPVAPPEADAPPVPFAPPEADAPPVPTAPPVAVVPPLPVPTVPPEPRLPPLAEAPAVPGAPPLDVAPPVPVPEEPPVAGGGVAAESAGGVPVNPVALSAVIESTAMPPPKVTLAGLWVDRLLGEAQLPVNQPLGTLEPSNSSRHCIWKAPLVYEEYCAQLMYSWTGNVDVFRVPPNVEFPSQVLKCIDIPWAAFLVYSVTLDPVTLRTCLPSMNQAM